MKKILLSSLITAQLLTQLHAGGDIVPVQMYDEPMVEQETEESKFYVVAKGMLVLGNDVEHDHALLDGDQDYGYGLDIGYRLGNGFALEYDFSYGTNTVTEKKGEELEEATGKYYTSALDIVYTFEMTESVGIFAKAGYEYEWEKISKYDIDTSDDGFVFGLGVEVAMNEDYKFIAEYEHSTIEGPRGDSIFAGVMFNF